MSKNQKVEPVVLQVLPELEMGGVELGTVEIATALQEAGIKNFVASQGGRLTKELTKNKIKHLTLPLKTKNIFKMRKNADALAEFIKKNGINIVHARSRAPAWSAYWAAQKAGAHYMTTFHGTYGLGPWGIKKIYNKIMTFGERVIVISNHIKNHILKNYPLTAPEKLRLIHRCVDIDKFDPAKVSQERIIKASKEYNIPEDKPVLTLIGRVTRWKGQHMLVEALSKMKNTNCYCVIAGDDQGRVNYVDEIKNLAKKLKVSDRIGFYGKVLDPQALMQVSTVILSTAIEPEAFGRISVEGQAMGKIVVASNIGGSLDTIQDGVTGKLYKSDDTQALADALDWALSLTEAQKAKIIKAGIKNVKDNFTKQIMCDKTIAVYRELVEQK